MERSPTRLVRGFGSTGSGVRDTVIVVVPSHVAKVPDGASCGGDWFLDRVVGLIGFSTPAATEHDVPPLVNPRALVVDRVSQRGRTGGVASVRWLVCHQQCL